MPTTPVPSETTPQSHRPPPSRTRPEPAGSNRALTRRHLPGAITSSARLPAAEFAAFLVVVPLLSIPALLAAMTAAWAAAATIALTAVVGWLCVARRVVIGDGWIADRRLWHYRVTHGGQLRAVELIENAHGGVLRLSPHTGRPHRLRRSEFGRPEARAALRSVLAAGSPAVSATVHAALAAPAHSAALPPAG